MNITLMDVFLTMGIVAFTLLATLFAALLIMLYQINKRVNDAKKASMNILEDTLKAKYGIQLKILSFILSLIGGGRR